MNNAECHLNCCGYVGVDVRIKLWRWTDVDSLFVFSHLFFEINFTFKFFARFRFACSDLVLHYIRVLEGVRSTTNDVKGLLMVWHKNVWWIITHECGRNLIYRVTTSKGFLRSIEIFSFFSSFSRLETKSRKHPKWDMGRDLLFFTAQDSTLKSSLIVEFINPNQT